MCRLAVGEQFDESSAQICSRSIDRPARRRIHCQEVVPVDAQGRQTVASSARREGRLLASRNALEGRDGILVVDDIQNDGGAIDAGKGAGMMEVALRGGTFPNPSSGASRVLV